MSVCFSFLSQSVDRLLDRASVFLFSQFVCTHNKKKLINKSTLTQTHIKIPVVKRMNTKHLQSRIALGQEQMFGSVGAYTHTHPSTPNTRTLKKENKQAEGVC